MQQLSVCFMPCRPGTAGCLTVTTRLRKRGCAVDLWKYQCHSTIAVFLECHAAITTTVPFSRLHSRITTSSILHVGCYAHGRCAPELTKTRTHTTRVNFFSDTRIRSTNSVCCLRAPWQHVHYFEWSIHGVCLNSEWLEASTCFYLPMSNSVYSFLTGVIITKRETSQTSQRRNEKRMTPACSLLYS